MKCSEQKKKESLTTELKNSNHVISAATSQMENVLEKGKLKIFEIMSVYEEAIGIKEIKEAQQSVLDVLPF